MATLSFSYCIFRLEIRAATRSTIVFISVICLYILLSTIKIVVYFFNSLIEKSYNFFLSKSIINQLKNYMIVCIIVKILHL